MAERKEYIFKTVGTTEIAADVYFQRNRSGKTPIAFYVHGGSFTVGSKDALNKNYSDRLVDMGFVVVSPNYRLSPTITAFDGAVTDTLDAYKWAQSTLPDLLKKDAGVEVDPGRVVSWGHSCGATLALLTAGLPTPPRAILDLYGFVYLEDSVFHSPAQLPAPPIEEDFVKQIYNDDPPPTSAPFPFGPKGFDLSHYRGAWMIKRAIEGTQLKEVVGDGDYARIDPASLFQGGNFPPTYIIHGSADSAVPLVVSQRAHETLQSQGVETELVVIDGAQHGFDTGSAPGDDRFEAIQKGFDFLKARI